MASCVGVCVREAPPIAIASALASGVKEEGEIAHIEHGNLHARQRFAMARHRRCRHKQLVRAFNKRRTPAASEAPRRLAVWRPRMRKFSGMKCGRHREALRRIVFFLTARSR